MKVYVSYIKEGCLCTYSIKRGKVNATGDTYPGNKKGIAAMKRDCADLVSHLRKNKDEIIISRYK